MMSIVRKEDQEAFNSFIQQEIFNDLLGDQTIYKGVINKSKLSQCPEVAEVEVHYECRLLDGTLLDSTYEREPLSCVVGKKSILQAFEYSIPTMHIGERALVLAKPTRTYGPQGTDGVPPGAVLAFDITLVSAKAKAVETPTSAPELSSPDTIRLQGNSLFHSGKYSEASECYIASMRMGGEDWAHGASMSNLVACQLKLGLYEQALITSQRGLSLAGLGKELRPKLLVRCGNALVALGRPEEARDAANEALKLHPKLKAAEKLLRAARSAEVSINKVRTEKYQEMFSALGKEEITKTDDVPGPVAEEGVSADHITAALESIVVEKEDSPAEEEEEEEEVSDSYESESEEKDPLLLLIESKVAQMLGAPSGYIEELPEEAQDSLKELSLLQDKINQQHDAMIIRRAAHAHTFESRSKELDIEALQEVSKSPGGLSAFWTNAFGVFHRRGEFNVSTADLQILRFLLDVRGGVVLERPGDDLGDRRYVECQFATNPFFSRSHLRVEYDDKSAETSRVDWRRQDPTKVGLLARLGDGQSFFDLFQPDDGEEALSSLLDMAESVRLRIVSRAISAWFEREEQE
eukprot:gnl/Dysnectes_brevis/2050_a2367_1308.p1 GENE.gnl/Dysnectes_brevis/2050_a2367_1308~~gnl/Dysnectes_brevis/2050_a2367_1308.p1  ORF type:complete len:579 (+),score=190.91 gnl/Dysnectes_brevis/2050_a2367_1308:32-1768(+)